MYNYKHGIEVSHRESIMLPLSLDEENIELFDSSYNIIRNNTFNGEGTHPYGIAGYRANDNIINNNVHKSHL